MNSKKLVPFNFTKIGTWWSGDRQIDLVALSKNEALFVECKWQNRKTDVDILINLVENAKFVNWQREKDHFMVVSRSGFTLKAEDFAENREYRLLLKLN